jgi:hypothetical protein
VPSAKVGRSRLLGGRVPGAAAARRIGWPRRKAKAADLSSTRGPPCGSAAAAASPALWKAGVASRIASVRKPNCSSAARVASGPLQSKTPGERSTSVQYRAQRFQRAPPAAARP